MFHLYNASSSKLIFLLGLSISLIISPVFSQTGVLDMTFGNAGKVVSYIRNNNAHINDVAIQSDGKIIAAGMLYEPVMGNFLLVRYNTDGSIDSAFGFQGAVTKNIGVNNNEIRSIAIQADGKIVAGGIIHLPYASAIHFALVRFNVNGSTDSSFGNNGLVTTAFEYDPDVIEQLTKLIIKPDGKILAGGYSYNSFLADSPKKVIMAQYNENGSYDSSFGINGTVISSTGTSAGTSNGFTMVLDSNNKIVAGGSHGTSSFGAMRFNSDGSSDSTFGLNGFGDSAVSFHGRDMLLQPDGKIVFAGNMIISNKETFVILRYNNNGSFDTTFGDNGKVVAPVSNLENNATSIYLKQDGKLWVSGYNNRNYPATSADFALLQYTSQGNPDSTFGKRGVVITDFSGKEDFTYSSAVQEDGKIVLAGISRDSAKSYVALARYEKNMLEKYNTFKGLVFFDKNSNGIKEASEPPFAAAKLVATKPLVSTITMASSDADFSAYLDTGLYICKVMPYSTYYNAVPPSHNTFFDTYFNTDSVSFAIQPIPGKRDLEINVIPVSVARPGFSLQYKIFYLNKGTDTIANGTIKFIKSSKLNFISSLPTTTSIDADTLQWSFSNLKPSDTASIIANLSVQEPPVVNVGDTLTSITTISSGQPDLTVNDNSSKLIQIARGSYDPNDKTENHGGRINISQVTNGEFLLYTIRFQNTGTDTAFSIYLKDTLSNSLDWNSFEMLTASANYQLTITNEANCLWTFSNINLVDSNQNEAASHGYLSYRIRPKANVAVEDVIINTAAIYFDYNLPINTNSDSIVIEGAVMPLKLLSFTAIKNGTNNLLQWHTAQETNVDRFEIERSFTGRDYSLIGKLNVGLSKYDFTDVKPFSNVNYYRLKMTDKDGSFEYSPVRVVNNRSGFYINIYPHPANDKLNIQIQSSKTEKADISVTDISGKTLITKALSLTPGVNNSFINVQSLNKGVYFLKIVTSETSEIRKIIIGQ